MDENQVRYMIGTMFQESPQLKERSIATWVDIEKAICDRADSLKGKNRKKVYEVHHEIEVARKEFLIGIIYGDVEAAKKKALGKVGLMYTS